MEFTGNGKLFYNALTGHAFVKQFRNVSK